MLNLNELEKRLDKALSQETEESLKEWLLNQRNYNFLGIGHFEMKKNKPFTYSQQVYLQDTLIEMLEEKDDASIFPNLSLAA